MRNNAMVHKYLHEMKKDIGSPVGWRKDSYDSEPEEDI
jgi:hypothetical protein